MRRHRLGKRDLEQLLIGSSGWRQIVTSAEARRRAERLMSLGLVRRPRRVVDGVYALELTPTGNALGCLVARARGYRLKRSGVRVLAQHRRRVLERYDFARGLRELVTPLPGVVVSGGLS